MTTRNVIFGGIVLLVCFGHSTVFGQVTRGARERQQDRVERRAERQLNRIDRGFYFNDATWAEIQPWFNTYRFGPLVELPADRRGQVQTRFGFTDADKSDDWYFDYYDPGYSVIYPPRGNVTGTYGLHYFDSDGDGIYDVYYNVYDKDSDGIFDDQEEYRFSKAGAVVKPETSAYTSFRESRTLEIKGEILAIKKATVHGDQHVVIHVRAEDGKEIPVDVGHAAHLKVQLDVGDRVLVRGYMVDTGDRSILISDHIEVNQEKFDVSRTPAPVTGTIVETRKVKMHDQDNLMLVLEVDGSHRFVDLGPAADLNVEFQPNTKLTVYGVPVQINEGQMLMANRIEYSDQTYPILRRGMRR